MTYTYSNIKINYEVLGTGKPILIIHGLGCDLEMMKACMEPIFQKHSGYKRFYIDLPGMGKSEAPIEYASADSILDILLSFIADVIRDKFLLIGESYGGYLARGLLSSIGNNVNGLMLLCPVVEPIKDKRHIPEFCGRFLDDGFLSNMTEEEKTGFLGYAVIADEETYRRYKDSIEPGLKLANDAFISVLEEKYSFSFDVDSEIQNRGGFSNPSLFICGRQDFCVGYEDTWSLLKDYPRAAFHILDAAGHNLQIEQPQIFNVLVENWLNRTEKYK